MPASMISAPTGGSPNVMGSSMATVATVPIPGSTPTSVPTSAPNRQKARLCRLVATEKPSTRLCRSSDIRSVPGPELERQLQQVDEQPDAKCRHGDGGNERLNPAQLGRAHDRDHKRGEGRCHQSKRRN